MSVFQPTKYAIGHSEYSRDELTDAYRSLEGRAVALMEGWENMLGSTPDDLGQQAVWEYYRLRCGGRDEDEARTLASYRLNMDFIDLKKKVRNNPQEYFSDEEPETLEDEFDDPGEAGVEVRQQVVIYFSPDQVDWMADRLTARELEAVILVFEADLTHVDAARKMHTTRQRVDSLVKSSLRKLGEEWATSH